MPNILEFKRIQFSQVFNKHDLVNLITIEYPIFRGRF